MPYRWSYAPNFSPLLTIFKNFNVYGKVAMVRIDNKGWIQSKEKPIGTAQYQSFHALWGSSLNFVGAY